MVHVKTKILENEESEENKVLKEMYQSIVGYIIKKQLILAGYIWRKEKSLLRIVLENTPQQKTPLGSSRLTWEDTLNKDMEKVKPGEY